MNTPRYVVDNCTLINFAVVDRLDLISSVLVDAAWLAAVAFETRRSARYVPTLDHAACRQWLGEPIETDLPEDNARVETIRLALGGTRREPLRNLGEAQSIHAILTRTTYIGEHRFNTRSHKDRQKKPESEVAIMAVPPLIERELFDAVQARLKSRQPMVTPMALRASKYLLLTE